MVSPHLTKGFPLYVGNEPVLSFIMPASCSSIKSTDVNKLLFNGNAMGANDPFKTIIP